MILKSFGDLYGFVGYNGGGIFYAFFPDCSAAKLDVILKAIGRQVEKYNKMNPQLMIHCVCEKAVSGTDSVFEIRDLLRLAMQRMHSGQISIASEYISGDHETTDAQDPAVTENHGGRQ